jgi:hypothetical protein
MVASSGKLTHLYAGYRPHIYKKNSQRMWARTFVFLVQAGIGKPVFEFALTFAWH